MPDGAVTVTRTVQVPGLAPRTPALVVLQIRVLSATALTRSLERTVSPAHVAQRADRMVAPVRSTPSTARVSPAVDADELVPAAFVADTEKEYETPAFSPGTTHVVSVVVQDAEPGVATAV